MPATNDELLAELVRIRKAMEALALHLGAGPRKGAAASSGNGADVPAIAPDSDLDSSHGDRKVNAKPRDWTGENFKGSRMSECPAEFLDLYAAMLDHFASKQEDEKKAHYDRLDASRARGWAKRKREETAREEADRNHGTPPPVGGDEDFG